MTTVLVTGGGGYIGSVLTEALLDEGHDVRVLDRFFFGLDLLGGLAEHERLTLIRDDIRSVDRAAFDGVEVVMHLAAISNDPACDLDPRITQAVNLDGTMHVARQAKAAGVTRFLFSSSCSIYGAGGSATLDERSPTSPVSLYAKTKIEAETMLDELCDERFAVTHLRNATVYGTSRRMRFDLVINIMTLYAYNNRKVFVTGGGQQWRPLVHVRDVARAFIAVMEAPVETVRGESFNVGSPEQNFQVHRLAQMVRDVVPYTNLELVPDDPDRRSYHVNFSKIAAVLAYETKFTPYEGIVEVKQGLERGELETGLRTKTLDYYRHLLDAERLVKEVSHHGTIF